MLIRLTPRRDDRAAMAFEEVASGLDSGLRPVMLGADADDGDDVLAQLFARRGIALDGVEERVLAAAWRAGRPEVALRGLAEGRRERAAFARELLKRIAYPALLAGMAILASMTTGWSQGRMGVVAVTIAAVALLCALCWQLYRGLSRGLPWALKIPLLADCARDLAELPYLEVLRGLYGAGVPLQQAHAEAVAVYPIAAGRGILQQADRHLQGGQQLAAALNLELAATTVLDRETLSLVASGELAGSLEESLGSALKRRRMMASQRMSSLVRIVGGVIYLAAVLIAVYVIFSFYSGLYGRLRGIR